MAPAREISIEERLTRTEASVDSIGRELTTLAGRVENLQTSMTSLPDQILEKLSVRHDDKQTQVRDEVTRLEVQLREDRQKEEDRRDSMDRERRGLVWKLFTAACAMIGIVGALVAFYTNAIKIDAMRYTDTQIGQERVTDATLTSSIQNVATRADTLAQNMNSSVTAIYGRLDEWQKNNLPMMEGQKERIIAIEAQQRAIAQYANMMRDENNRTFSILFDNAKLPSFRPSSYFLKNQPDDLRP